MKCKPGPVLEATSLLAASRTSWTVDCWGVSVWAGKQREKIAKMAHAVRATLREFEPVNIASQLNRTLDGIWPIAVVLQSWEARK
jgi:hypothetical protein